VTITIKFLFAASSVKILGRACIEVASRSSATERGIVAMARDGDALLDTRAGAVVATVLQSTDAGRFRMFLGDWINS
jgi:hypothetical protein